MSNSRFNEQTYYEILEIKPGAPQHEIHEAYRRAKETYSSDSPALYSMFSKDEARELLELIEEAFSTLSHQARRAAYDRQLSRQGDSQSANSDLPDLEPQQEGQAEKESEKEIRMPEHVPDGFAKTAYGVYEIDEELENLIENPETVNGPFLQKVRMYKQINLVQVSEVSRISKAYLGALEADDYEALPAPVFVRGFVVQVARILGMNEKKIADAYMKHYRAQNGER